GVGLISAAAGRATTAAADLPGSESGSFALMRVGGATGFDPATSLLVERGAARPALAAALVAVFAVFVELVAALPVFAAPAFGAGAFGAAVLRAGAFADTRFIAFFAFAFANRPLHFEARLLACG